MLPMQSLSFLGLCGVGKGSICLVLISEAGHQKHDQKVTPSNLGWTICSAVQVPNPTVVLLWPPGPEEQASVFPLEAQACAESYCQGQ